MEKNNALLNINKLSIGFQREKSQSYAVNGLDLTINAGETFVLLGESGCGKTMTAYAILQLLPPGARVSPESSIQFKNQELLDLSEKHLRSIRGKDIGMIFQEPMTSLNPVLTVGEQVKEALKTHHQYQEKDLNELAIDFMQKVGISDAKNRMHQYPHQFSGGMKQRIMIAMALTSSPSLLIADEPTTALDVTVQHQILLLLKKLQLKLGMAILFITHDIEVAKLMGDRIGIMYAGQMVEVIKARDIMSSAQHPYTQGLIRALPSSYHKEQNLPTLNLNNSIISYEGCCRFSTKCSMVMEKCLKQEPRLYIRKLSDVRCFLYEEPSVTLNVSKNIMPFEIPNQKQEVEEALLHPVLHVEDLKVSFPIKKGILRRVKQTVQAVNGVKLTLYPGKTLALVGESGCGKTTTGKAVMQLLPYTGQIDLSSFKRRDNFSRQSLNQRIQMVFQDAFSSLNPKLTIKDIILEGIYNKKPSVSSKEQLKMLQEVLDYVGLDMGIIHRFPHEFSGGQRQRIAIARALILKPDVIIFDEPTSALDLSIQAHILNLLKNLQTSFNLAYLFISHNLSVVSYLADEICIMYLGHIVERGPTSLILTDPKHPYTKLLFSSAPERHQSFDGSTLESFAEELPSAIHPPTGCHFHPRCPFRLDKCNTNYPKSYATLPHREVSCYLYENQ